MLDSKYLQAVYAFERDLQARLRAEDKLTWEKAMSIASAAKGSIPVPSVSSESDIPPGLLAPSGIERLNVAPGTLNMMFSAARSVFESPPPVSRITPDIVDMARNAVQRQLQVDLSDLEVWIAPGEGNPHDDAFLVGNADGAPLLIFPSRRREAKLMAVRAMAMAAHHIQRRKHGTPGYLYADDASEEFVAAMVALPHLLGSQDAGRVVFALRSLLKGLLAIALEMYARDHGELPTLEQLKASRSGASLQGVSDGLLGPIANELLSDLARHQEASEKGLGLCLALVLAPWQEALPEFMAMNTIETSLDDKIAKAFAWLPADVFESVDPMLRRHLADAERANGTAEGVALYERSFREVVH